MTTTTPTQSHLAREIDQQPALWRELGSTLNGRKAEIDAFLAPVLARPEARIVLTGAGTSAYAGQVAAPALSRALGRRVEAIASTDLVADPRDHLVPDVLTLLVSFARSGDSPESVAATELADALVGEVRHLVLTCNPDGQLARTHDGRETALVLQMPAAANDQSFAMTSSFTCMTLAALLTLSGDDDPAARTSVLAVAAEGVLAQRSEVELLAQRRPERVVYLGSGPFTGLARESALKLTELTAGEVVVLPESSLGFRHGPKAVLTPETLAVVYVSGDPYTRRYDLDLVVELAAQQPVGQVLAIDGAAEGHELGVPDGIPVLRVPGVDDQPDAYRALPAVLVAQVFGLTTSLLLGHTPDNPFPTGEVNRVVQGVTVHPLDA